MPTNLEFANYCCDLLTSVGRCIPKRMFGGYAVSADGLTIALVGVGVAAALHAVSHIVGRDLGGTPERDIPLFAGLAEIGRAHV